MGFRFIHTADLHLDCPFVGITDEKVSAKLMEATFDAFHRIIDLAIENRVAFLLIAGDIYDSKDKSLKAQLRFQKEMRRLADAGVEAYVVYGNHDPANKWSAALDYPPSVNIFPHGGKPKSKKVVRNGEHIATIHGWSYPSEAVQEDMASQFAPDPNAPYNVALLHCNCGSSSEYENYAPCTPSELQNSGYDYWALGHIHKRSVLSDKKPLIVYPGNPQGLNPKEIGPKGCYLVEVGDDGSTKLNFIATDQIRWHAEEISAENIARDEDLINTLRRRMDSLRREFQKPSLVRFILLNRSPLHSNLINDKYLGEITDELREGEIGEEQYVWIEAIHDKTKPTIDIDERRKANDLAGDFLRLIEEYRSDPTKLMELQKTLEPLYADRRAKKGLDHPLIAEWLDYAESLGLDRLI